MKHVAIPLRCASCPLDISTRPHLTTGGKLNFEDASAHFLDTLLLGIPGWERDNFGRIHILQLTERIQAALARQHVGHLKRTAVFFDTGTANATLRQGSQSGAIHVVPHACRSLLAYRSRRQGRGCESCGQRSWCDEGHRWVCVCCCVAVTFNAVRVWNGDRCSLGSVLNVDMWHLVVVTANKTSRRLTRDMMLFSFKTK